MPRTKKETAKPKWGPYTEFVGYGAQGTYFAFTLDIDGKDRKKKQEFIQNYFDIPHIFRNPEIKCKEIDKSGEYKLTISIGNAELSDKDHAFQHIHGFVQIHVAYGIKRKTISQLKHILQEQGWNIDLMTDLHTMKKNKDYIEYCTKANSTGNYIPGTHTYEYEMMIKNLVKNGFPVNRENLMKEAYRLNFKPTFIEKLNKNYAYVQVIYKQLMQQERSADKIKTDFEIFVNTSVKETIKIKKIMANPDMWNTECHILNDLDMMQRTALVRTINNLPFFNKRTITDQLPMLCYVGPKQTGKSFFAKLNPRTKEVATDACGVGRFATDGDQYCIVMDDFNNKQLMKKDNFTTIKQGSIGDSFPCKTNGGTHTGRAYFFVTMNERPFWITNDITLINKDGQTYDDDFMHRNFSAPFRRRTLTLFFDNGEVGLDDQIPPEVLGNPLILQYICIETLCFIHMILQGQVNDTQRKILDFLRRQILQTQKDYLLETLEPYVRTKLEFFYTEVVNEVYNQINSYQLLQLQDWAVEQEEFVSTTPSMDQIEMKTQMYAPIDYPLFTSKEKETTAVIPMTAEKKKEAKETKEEKNMSVVVIETESEVLLTLTELYEAMDSHTINDFQLQRKVIQHNSSKSRDNVFRDHIHVLKRALKGEEDWSNNAVRALLRLFKLPATPYNQVELFHNISVL